MDRTKTTITIATDLLKAVKILATLRDKNEYEIYEEALASYLGTESIRPGWKGATTSDEHEAFKLAREALRSIRARTASARAASG